MSQQPSTGPGPAFKTINVLVADPDLRNFGFEAASIVYHGGGRGLAGIGRSIQITVTLQMPDSALDHSPETDDDLTIRLYQGKIEGTFSILCSGPYVDSITSQIANLVTRTVLTREEEGPIRAALAPLFTRLAREKRVWARSRPTDQS